VLHSTATEWTLDRMARNSTRPGRAGPGQDLRGGPRPPQAAACTPPGEHAQWPPVGPLRNTRGLRPPRPFDYCVGKATCTCLLTVFLKLCNTPQHTYTHLYEYTYANPTSYEHLRRTELADLEIHELTIGISLSTGTSPITESIAPLNPRINLKKYKHPCQVEDLNPSRQVLPQGT
jgi:hypothetical protein